jgi:hypothetical protein
MLRDKNRRRPHTDPTAPPTGDVPQLVLVPPADDQSPRLMPSAAAIRALVRLLRAADIDHDHGPGGGEGRS